MRSFSWTILWLVECMRVTSGVDAISWQIGIASRRHHKLVVIELAFTLNHIVVREKLRFRRSVNPPDKANRLPPVNCERLCVIYPIFGTKFVSRRRLDHPNRFPHILQFLSPKNNGIWCRIYYCMLFSTHPLLSSAQSCIRYYGYAYTVTVESFDNNTTSECGS